MNAHEARAAAAAWLAVDPDPQTRDELERLLAGPDDPVIDRFSDRLQFGTAGLRGPLGAGPTRMNRVIVQRTAFALGQWIVRRGLQRQGVAVAFDARHNSEVFARDTCRVLAELGVRSYLLDGPAPTPVLASYLSSFVTTGPVAGVVVTASHNPPADNGYKVFLADGSQIVPPIDAEISALIPDSGEIVLAAWPHGLIDQVGTAAVDGYLHQVVPGVRLCPEVDASTLRVVYTPMHGVGLDTLRSAFSVAGLPVPTVVPEQADPDPDFPTVAFPNPEEPGALDLALALAASVDADLVLANDPDADRLGAAIPTADGWRALKGDEIGWLLADHILRHTSGDDRLVVTTLVSSSLLGKMATHYGVRYAETFTGFKWIGQTRRAHPTARFVFGYEQALGYLVTERPNDKDGISAAILMTEVAALARAEGTTLVDRLEAISARYGRHIVGERSVPMAPAVGTARVEAIAADPPGRLAGVDVTGVERFHEANLLRLWCADGARVQLRPSGTEPKVKIYVETIDGTPEPYLAAVVELLAGEVS